MDALVVATADQDAAGVLEPGIEKVEDYLGIDNLYESANTPLISLLNNSIKSSALFMRDKD